MDTYHILHIIFVGAWLGCVAVEMLIERAAGFNPDLRLIVARLHVKIDHYIELPLVFAVLITGLLIFDVSRFNGVYAAKVIFGMTAVLINLYCYFPVMLRKQAMEQQNIAKAKQQNRIIKYLSYFGFIPAVGALSIAILY